MKFVMTLQKIPLSIRLYYQMVQTYEQALTFALHAVMVVMMMNRKNPKN
jgi:hypothetical protein